MPRKAGWYLRTFSKLRSDYPNKDEVRQICQEACVDEQGSPGQTQTLKESLQRVKTRTSGESISSR